MVRETYEPGMTVSLVARKHGVNPNQVFHWRKLERIGALTRSVLGKRWCRQRSWKWHDDRFGSCSGCSARRRWGPRSCAKRWRLPGFQQIRHTMSIAQTHGGQPGGKECAYVVDSRQVKPSVLLGLPGCHPPLGRSPWGRMLMPKAPLFFHHFGVPIGHSLIYRSHIVQVACHPWLPIAGDEGKHVSWPRRSRQAADSWVFETRRA
jgi:Transposase